MQTSSTYFDAAKAYAEGVRAFYTPAAPERAVRGGEGALPAAELASRAEALAGRSAALTQAAAAALEPAAPGDELARLDVSVSLLAKALTDLQVSSTLWEAAEAAEAPDGRPGRGAERSAAITRPADLNRTLDYLMGKEPEETKRASRGAEIPTTLKKARAQVTESAPELLTLIRDRAASTGWNALGGIAGIGVSQLAGAAGLVGMQIAEALGQAENVSRLYEMARAFLGQAYASLQTLIGPALTQNLGSEAITWIKKAASDEKFNKLVEKLYQTEATCEALKKLAAESKAGLPNYVSAIQKMDALETAYRKQIELVEKILKIMKFVPLLPVAALPQGKLVQAALYLLVGGYVVLAGADYVDAQNLPGILRIDRVPGVRRIIETNLA